PERPAEALNGSAAVFPRPVRGGEGLLLLPSPPSAGARGSWNAPARILRGRKRPCASASSAARSTPSTSATWSWRSGAARTPAGPAGLARAAPHPGAGRPARRRPARHAGVVRGAAAAALGLPPEAPLRLEVVPVPLIDLSSTDLRERAARGGSLRYLAPRAVE